MQIASDENHELSLHPCDVVVLGSTEATRRLAVLMTSVSDPGPLEALTSQAGPGPWERKFAAR